MSGTETGGPTPGYLVWRLSTRWRVAVDRAIAPLGLTHAQYSLLSSLYGMQAVPGSASPARHRAGHGRESAIGPSQRALADHTGLEPLYVSKLARGLHAAGLLTRAADPADSRAVQLSLTDHGVAVTEQAIGIVRQLVGQLMAPLGGPASARTATFVRELSLLLSAPLAVDTEE